MKAVMTTAAFGELEPEDALKRLARVGWKKVMAALRDIGYQGLFD